MRKGRRCQYLKVWLQVRRNCPLRASPSLGESESEVAQSCPTLCDPMDCSLPHSSVHGIFQAIVLEWVASSFSRGSSQPRDQSQVSHVAGRFFTTWATREARTDYRHIYILLYFALLHFTDIALFFKLEFEACGNIEWSKSIDAIFPIAFTHFMCLSDFGNSCNILSFLIIIIFFIMLCD